MVNALCELGLSIEITWSEMVLFGPNFFYWG